MQRQDEATPANRPAPRPRIPTVPVRRKPLGQILLERGAITPQQLLRALALRRREAARLGEILLTRGWVREPDLMAALAYQWKVNEIDLAVQRPDPRLIDAFGADLCLRETVVPWRCIGGVCAVATARPEYFAQIVKTFPPELGPYRMLLASESAIHQSLLTSRQTALIRRAERLLEPQLSCRPQPRPKPKTAFTIACAAGVAVAATAPIATLSVLFCWMIVTLAASSVLRACACAAHILHERHPPAKTVPRPKAHTRLPIISILVPMFDEPTIAPRLIARLARLNYPPELLDVLLVIEESDHATRTALAQTPLPIWMRVITVPNGPIRTKPRAMNFALNFCRGSIVGVYDAEDMPDPDQLHDVVAHFAKGDENLACVQGILDYYNPRINWLSRCFTIEYATWFRVILPGLSRLKMPIPLGGTTLFFRRDLLETLGGWDAHNVTEDADLGIRLARKGYRTELMKSVTREEANCRPRAWIKQRSRWLKGYAMTWMVHMRNPAQLWRDLGPRQFIGFQIMFLGCVSQYLLAPLLWSFWLLSLGLPHPLQPMMPPDLLSLLIAFFITTELVQIGTGIYAVRGAEHRHLLPWVPSLHLYFPIGALAGWKAVSELIHRPFYWDKTDHGIFDTHPDLLPVPIPVAVTAPAPTRERLSIAPLID
ncbi:glycosyl transferase [Thioclava sp. SK-1]|nr:glycosyl transferase [Thioclava sp. SK-1]